MAIHVVVVYCHIRVIVDFYIGYLVVVEVVFVYFFAYDVQSDVILFLYHDFHLVEDEFQFLSTVHWPVGLNLHFLENFSCFEYIVIVLFTLDDQKHTPSVLNLVLWDRVTSRNIFLAVTSRIFSIKRVRLGSGVCGIQVMASWII